MKVLLLLTTIHVGLFLLPGSNATQVVNEQRPKALSLRGEVESVEIKELDPSSAVIKVRLRMKLVNTSPRPVILLQKEPLFPGAGLAKSPEDFETGNTLAWDYGGPSNDVSAEWSTLRASLDKPSPPRTETRILMPNESWSLEVSVAVVVPTDPSRYISSRKKESLQVLQQLSPVWLQVDCDLWPWNVEELKPEREQLPFGHKLQKRWKDVGLLWLENMRSEPIMLDLKTATYKTRTP